MNAVDLITHEASDLPEALQAEVLDFIGYLKTRHPQAPAVAASDSKLAELMVFFAPYRKDFGSFVFDRDEANARRQPVSCTSRSVNHPIRWRAPGSPICPP